MPPVQLIAPTASTIPNPHQVIASPPRLFLVFDFLDQVRVRVRVRVRDRDWVRVRDRDWVKG